MFSLAALLLTLAAPPAPARPNQVEICSLAQGAACVTLDAAALDPSVGARAGQLAFIDPRTGMLVPPTAEQLGELGARPQIEEQVAAGGEPVVDVLPDGTRRAHLRGAFMVDLTVTLQPAMSGSGERP